MTKPSLSRPRRIWGALALLAGAILLASCSTGGKPESVVTVTASNSQSGGTSGASTSTPSSSSKPRPTKPVHVKLFNEDGTNVGIGMPIIAFFSAKIYDARPFSQATKVTVNGQPIKGGWYFEHSSYYKGYPIEAHWRPQHYWPAHASIHMDLPVKGLSAGRDLGYDDSLTLDFSTDASHISTVDDVSHRMTVVSDGQVWGTFPVSLGADNTPTARGIKVIMEKGTSICMSGPGYYECGIKYTQRLTYGGEYLHSAPWNIGNINRGVDSSNGCTNLLPADAKKLYDFLRVGDVVIYPNVVAPTAHKMQLGEGYGDWNVPWPLWLTGGIVPTGAGG